MQGLGSLHASRTCSNFVTHSPMFYVESKRPHSIVITETQKKTFQHSKQVKFYHCCFFRLGAFLEMLYGCFKIMVIFMIAVV